MTSVLVSKDKRLNRHVERSERSTTLYIGVTSDLPTRISPHINHDNPRSFTAKYQLNVCVYYESFMNIEEAINREKELKGWKRVKKNTPITQKNPTWRDLWREEIVDWL